MPPILLYLLKVSISLSVIWLFYQLLLRRLTFYTLNRWYLLGYSVLAFFIPLINIYPILRDEAHSGEPYLIQFIPVVGGREYIAAAETHSGIGGWILLLWVIAAGTVALLVRTAIRGLSLYRLRKSARLIEGIPLRIYQVDASIIPFSFGNSIYINQDLHTEQQWSDIILHEYVHIRQRHTLDILVTELICMLNWYNPFSWLMRWSIRQNLEFIADQQVLGSGVDRKGYQYHLLTVLGQPRYRLANNFNFSSLKKRIVMMNKIRSARLHLLKFLFVLPLAAVLLVAFRDKRIGRPVVTTGPDVMMGAVATARPGSVILAGHAEAAGAYSNVMRDRHKTTTRRTAARDTSDPQWRDTVSLSDKKGDYKPLFIVDGQEVTNAIMTALNPNRIESIAVHKQDEVSRSYGEKGKNGVIMITLKKEVTIFATHDGQVAATMNTKDGPMTIIGDTLRINRP